MPKRFEQSASVLAFAVVGLLVPATCLAEVCDKALGNDHWIPEDGPVGAFVDWSSTWPWLLGTGLLVALSILLRSRAVAWASTAALLLVGFVLGFDILGDDEVRSLAIREGCLHPSESLIQVIGFLVLATTPLLLIGSGLLRPRHVHAKQSYAQSL
jgi:hypothetical protein